MSSTFIRRCSAAALAGLVSLALAGCGYDVDPPVVVWPEGEPTGPWEDDPWVEAVRESEVQRAVAAVTLDYTTEDLVRVVGVESAVSGADWRQGHAVNEEWMYPVGPRPMVVLDVEESEDGSRAIVTVCEHIDWWIDPDRPEPPEELRGSPGQREVTLEADGSRRVAYYGGGSGPDAACDMSGAARGYFDPLPDPYATYAPVEVKEPEV